MDAEMIKRIVVHIKEIKVVYELSDAESICMTQMANALLELGYPAELHLKCLKALTAIQEMCYEEYKLSAKEKK